MNVSTIILQNLFAYSDYSHQVLPYIKVEYFETKQEKVIFTVIENYILKYNSLPSRDVIIIELNNISSVTDDIINYFKENFVDNSKSDNELQWLVDTTEKWCQNRSLHLGLQKAINIYSEQDANSNLSVTAIPDILQKSLAVSFDTHIGHDFFTDIEKRYEEYHREEARLKFPLETLNRLTNDGVPQKTLNIFMGGPNTGKSLILCSLASDWMMAGKKVLYISLEMSEEEIVRRVDANILDVNINELNDIEHDRYMDMSAEMKAKSGGDMIIKEYPTTTAHAGHFRHLMKELELKRQFKPHVVMIDYLNICASSRIRQYKNSYEYVKSISEEVRGLAMEFQIPIFTGTQTNREGHRSSDPDMTDISESFGSAMTCDLLVGMVATDELEEQGQLGLSVIKSRFAPRGAFERVGQDTNKMRIFDLQTNNTNAIVSNILSKSQHTNISNMFQGYDI